MAFIARVRRPPPPTRRRRQHRGVPCVMNRRCGGPSVHRKKFRRRFSGTPKSRHSAKPHTRAANGNAATSGGWDPGWRPPVKTSS